MRRWTSSLASRLAEHLHIEQAEAEQAIVRLSIITHILQAEHVRAMAERFGGEKSLLPPPWERVNGDVPGRGRCSATTSAR